MEPELLFPRRIRSFVRREGRLTAGQAQALEALWPVYGIQKSDQLIDLDSIFGRQAPYVLEIGFGMGQSLLAMAKAHPDINFIGIEVHQPGVGALLAGMQRENITNIRVFAVDAIDVIRECIPDRSLLGVQLFFPDPWPKRRHSKRRIVQIPFIELLATKITMNGFLHMATDWQDYATHMQAVLQQVPKFKAVALDQAQFVRPATKFERRGLNLGYEIREFLYLVL